MQTHTIHLQCGRSLRMVCFPAECNCSLSHFADFSIHSRWGSRGGPWSIFGQRSFSSLLGQGYETKMYTPLTHQCPEPKRKWRGWTSHGRSGLTHSWGFLSHPQGSSDYYKALLLLYPKKNVPEDVVKLFSQQAVPGVQWSQLGPKLGCINYL